MKNLKLLLTMLMVPLSFSIAFAQTITFTLTQAPCNANGILTANFTGLTPPLTVDWGNGHVVHTNVTGSSDALTGYAGQFLSVLVTDANNAKAYNSYMGAPPFQVAMSATSGVCPALGTATATVTGGTSPYTYQWTDANSNVVSTTNPATGLASGLYDVMVTDANGCVFGSLYQWDSMQSGYAYVNNTSNINFNVSTTTANCTNGTASVGAITGGTSPYSYLWSNSATTSSISSLVRGYYYVTVTDAQGCSTIKGGYVNQSKTIGTNITSTPATCVQNNGAAISFGSGGIPPYTYLWNNSATTQSITGLLAGYYSVTVTDANGCTGTGGRYVNSSTPVNVTYTANASSCTSPTGSATLSITGGTTPYTIQWYTSPTQTGTSIVNAAPGNYSFKVTDAVGCVRTGTVVIPPVSNISLTLSSSNAVCTQSNGSISTTVTGGTTPYIYAWSNSVTTSSISSLAVGSYSVTVTDAVGCSVSKSRYIASSSPVNVGLSTTNASCIFSSDGAITANVSGGAAPYTYSWSNAATTSTITGLSKGSYYVTVTDANGCKRGKHTVVSYNPAGTSCYCTITGTVYNDANSNCVKDAGEQGIENIRIHCSGIGYAYTNANGVYSFKVPSGSYTISETVHAYYPLQSCQNNAVTVNATAATNCTHTVNFANSVNTIHDMYISTWNYTCARPGFPYKQKMIIKNMGTVQESAVVAGFKSDAQISIPTFAPSGIFTGTGTYHSVSGTSLSLAPKAAQTFFVNYSVPTNVPLNTSLVFKDTTAYAAPISNWLNDYSPWNNVNYYTPVVVGSYDPNFKEVNPKGKGSEGVITPNDTLLQYMVHFQNLGTYKAQNVYILDTLDKDLDWSTLTPVYQSHNCIITMSEDGVVRFQFDNIELPAKKDNEEASNGMVTYTIKTKKGLPIGTKFTNSAAIYFDFNEPVITNTTVNTIGPLSVKTIGSADIGSVTIYPNPTHDVFTIRVDDGVYTSAKVMNAMGQVYGSYSLNGKETQINMAGAIPGVYFILLQGVQGYKIEKVEKL